MKHAFMIMAHKNYNQLTKLLYLLDHPDVEIFLHIDKKSKEYIPPNLVHSKINLLKRIKVNWGGYSLIKCELELLKSALENNELRYFHLITGQDLILKKIDKILDFFEKYRDKNFIHFDRPIKSIDRYDRIKYYRIFQDIVSKRTFLGKIIISLFQERIFCFLQKILKIDRTKKCKNICFKSGSQFFSITREFAEYIVKNEKNIKKYFMYTTCGDEMFIQTLAYNSKFKETLYNKKFNDKCSANQRYIDWNTGTPYTWRDSDIEDLIESEYLFARKFDENIDLKIIDNIIKKIKSDI